MSTQTTGSDRLFGEGPLARVTSLVYSLMTVGVLLLLASLPTLVGLVTLSRDAADAPLAVLCLFPAGPALSAAVFALRQHRGDLTQLRPAAEFWRGYRMNVGGVLRLWVPFLLLTAVIAENLAHARAAGMAGWSVALAAVITLVASLWMANALVINSLFAFRTRDVARLSAYFLGRTKRVTLGNLCLLIVAFGIVEATSEAVLAVLGVFFAAALLRTAEPMVELVTKEFTA